jgi:nicotinate-nucleotide pyrophosphorylase (carboxylating)
MKPEKIAIHNQVAEALSEDLGGGKDLTANLIDSNQQSKAQLFVKEDAVLCGVDWFNETFLQINTNVQIVWSKKDGDTLTKGDKICDLSGQSRALLTGERTAINFLQTLSSVATQTYQIQNIIALAGKKTRVLDTRKTIPNLRVAQKYAVTCGGGSNHRIGLYDQLLIKENHIAACGGISKSIEKARLLYGQEVFIEIEVENIDELREALKMDVDQVLLDNFDISMVTDAVKLKTTLDANSILEVSGNITERNILSYARAGIDYISLGSLTKNIKAVDFSLLIDA